MNTSPIMKASMTATLRTNRLRATNIFKRFL